MTIKTLYTWTCAYKYLHFSFATRKYLRLIVAVVYAMTSEVDVAVERIASFDATQFPYGL